MSEFQMTHVALVGARMDSFAPLGFRNRSDLTMSRALPPAGPQPCQQQDRPALQAQLALELPICVHNCICDRQFPARERLSMHLRKFEGELRDNRNNEVIATVLNCGFRNRQMNPLELPDSMPLRQRCNMLMHLGPWQEAYRELERQFTAILASEVNQLDLWLASSRTEIDRDVAI